MLSVALTGNIGAGKTTVTELLRGWGATIIDADQLVREIQAPGEPTLLQIAERFGPQLIRPDGTLDRAALRAQVLADPSALKELNRLVHPEVHRRRQRLLEQARQRGDRIVVSDIPLLFEVADPEEFDAIILVDAPDTLRRERLLKARTLSADQVDRLMEAQLPSAAKRARSDYVIDNAGDFAALEQAAAAVWRALRARA
jgi:dephospho-CoA kinase